jgi:hypothetical protein
MKDLSILKDKPDPLALPDNDYPDWLWTLTDEALADSQSGKKAAELDAEGQVGDARGIGQAGKGFDRPAERRKLRARWVLVLALSFINIVLVVVTPIPVPIPMAVPIPVAL